MSMENFVEAKYGYVENIKEEFEYKNIDYRDTTVPLWNELYKSHSESRSISSQSQRQINLALCAAIIQLGKSMHYSMNNLYEKLENIDKKLNTLEIVVAEIK